jgi:exodeoxyribonuclease VII small subunit
VGGGWLTVRVPTTPSSGTRQQRPAQPATAQPASAQPAPTEPERPQTEVTDLAGLSYEQARDELVGVVARLEAGGASLEESLVLWERGEALATRCQEWLDGARARLVSARGDIPAGTDATPPNGSGADDASQQGGAR